jgi:uncharacterized membrane protein YfcA
MGSLLLLVGAGFLAGSMNAVAGGGSFVSLPALVFAGLPSTVANASSTVALLPGTLASAWGYREDARPLPGVRLWLFLAISVVGGLVGAVLLLSTTAPQFDRIVPWLLLFATLAFTFGRRVGEIMRRRMHIGQGALLAVQVVLAVYGGYFGGGVGIMMLAAWGLMLEADLKTLNPVRTVMVTACNAAAVVLFVAAGAVRWPETLATLVGATTGGYLGARVARRLPQPVLRGAIIAIAVVMTVVFFVRAV